MSHTRGKYEVIGLPCGQLSLRSNGGLALSKDQQSAWIRELYFEKQKPELGTLIFVDENAPLLSAESLRKLGPITGRSFNLGERLVPWLSNRKAIPLFPFQRVGVDWLISREYALLADDMGLGKTVQAIAGIRETIYNGLTPRVLVVAPRSLVLNWINEFLRWSPELTVTAVMPNSNNAEIIWNNRLDLAHVIVTSYEQVRQHWKILYGKFDLLVADEAHRLRNASSHQSRAFRKLTSGRTWLLSGTPVERDAFDMTTLMSILAPKIFSPSDTKLDLGVLRMKAQPFILRRTKADVLGQLPEVTTRHEILELTAVQIDTYRAILKMHIPNGVLAKFGKLRSVCDLDPSTGSSSKIDRAVEILRTIRQSGEKAVVFSFWKDPLIELTKRLEKSGFEGLYSLTADMTLHERENQLSKFKTNGTILLASAHIASEGLTLTEANHAIFLNQWWNPSLNRQAEDRIRRIGQSRPTFVYKFTCAGTVEDLIDRLHTRKEMMENELVELLKVEFSAEQSAAW